MRNFVIIVLCGRRAGGEREGKCSKLSEYCLVLKIIVSVEEEEEEKVEGEEEEEEKVEKDNEKGGRERAQ